MKIDVLYDKKRYDSIPDSGYILAFAYDITFFSKYKKENAKLLFDQSDRFVDVEYKNIHCFDEKTEYRLVSINNGNNIFEIQVFENEEQNMDDNLIFYDEMVIDDKYKDAGLDKIKIINRYKYSKYNTLVLDNYRLSS